VITFFKNFYYDYFAVVPMGDEEDEEIAEEYKGPEKEEPVYEEETPDIERGQNEPGADIDKLTNLIWNFRRAIENLDHLINTLKSAVDEKQKAEIKEQIIDARKRVLDAKKELDDYRLQFKDAAPSMGELELNLLKQEELALADAEKILKEGKTKRRKK